MRHARPDYERFQDPAGIIPEDEPVLLLRGQDIAAPGALRAYARLAAEFGAGDALVESVLGHADKMDAWQQTRSFKVPDL